MFTDYAINRMIAPELSTLVECKMDDVQDWSDNLSIYLTNHMYRPQESRNYYALGLLYLNKVDEAVKQYQDGKVKLSDFIPTKNQFPAKYFRILRHFEHSIGSAWQARVVATEVVRLQTGETLDPFRYTKGDNSIDEHVNMIYNASKHVDTQIALGTLPGDFHIPVWITNTGIKSADDYEVSFSQLHEFLTTCVAFAKILAADAPEALLEMHRRRAEQAPGVS